ncbi:ParB/RepB/Spo0J family partition protein [Luteibacter sp. NPDC031894]|uniref:ParB/RepB/Spo0J family partition protein n=1 Tax=Luteibacter sp. NPDC031894 TaxID=3390572 RepID=UPI003D0847C5
MNRQTLPLEKIQIGGGTQSRAALNEDVVAEYAETIKAATDLPPVTVFQDGKKFWLADGFHRFHAHRRAGAIQIEADVRVGTKRDAILHSVGANAAHGLRRSNADKRCAVRTLLADKEWGQWSDRQIADACGVSHPFVAALRNPQRAEQQQAHRDASSARKVESDSTLATAAAPAQPASTPPVLESSPAAVTQAGEAEQVPELDGVIAYVPADIAPDLVQVEGQDEALVTDDAELLHELQEENARLVELLRVAEANDLAAEAIKWKRIAENAERQQAQAMDSAAASQKRERWTKNQLMRCGAAVGEEDPAKIARAVELAVKQARAAA